MAKQARIVAICVNWNGGRVLSETIGSLLRSNYPNLEILVVDNASSDGSVETLPSTIKVLKLEKNSGYGGALNRALFMSQKQLLPEKADYYLILNNDVIIPPETVTRLLDCAQKNRAHVVAPRTLLKENQNRIEAAWGRLVWNHVLVKFHGKGARASLPRWNKTRPAQILLGNLLLVDSRLFEKIGYFDELFFMYHEEVDLLYRAWLSGLKSIYCANASVIHHGGASTRSEPERKVFWIRKNTVLFLRKYKVSTTRWAWYLATLGASLAFNLLMFRIRRFRTILSGVIEGFQYNSDLSQQI